MDSQIDIRPEREDDILPIHHLIKSAFQTVSYSNQKEHLLVDALRKNGALDLSLVAESEEKVIGHIAFTNITIDGKTVSWMGLAPASVLPKHQGEGVGSALIIEGLERIRKSGMNGCVVLGEPEYYNRFGFHQSERLKLEGVPPEYFLANSFTDDIPSGVVEYHPLFNTYG